MKWLLFFIIALCSCTRMTYVPVVTDTHHTDSVYIADVRIDSIFQRDSIVVESRGDTVFHTTYHDRFHYRERTDTIYKTQADTVKIEVPIPIKQDDSWWERTKRGIFDVTFSAIFIIVVYLFIRAFVRRNIK